MRIVVVDFAANTGGATSILKSFYQYLVDSNDNNEWVFLLNDQYIRETEKIKVVILKKEKESRMRRLAFDYFYGRKVIRKLNPDTLFYLQNTFIYGVHCRQIAYMDQPIPFQKTAKFKFSDPKQRSLAVYQYIISIMIKNACKKADRIIVQTEWMRTAISEQCKVAKERIAKVAPEIHIDYHPTGDESFDRKNFIFPANYMYYKNHRCVVEAAERLKRKVITDYQIRFTITKEDLGGEYAEQIVCCGNMKHEDVLKSLATQTLIFPSYIETYGLPLAEAKYLNSVILAADTEFSREILAGYENAYFFNAFCPQELAGLIEAVVTGKIERKPAKTPIGNDVSAAEGWAEVVKVITDSTHI